MRRAVDVFGFHLAALDLRQNSDVHEAVVGELLRGRASSTTTRRWRRRRASRCSCASSAVRGRCIRRIWTIRSATRSELAILRVAADVQRRYGAQALPNYVISKCQSVSDLLEVALLLKEVGLARESRLAVNIVPLFETIDDLDRCGDDDARGARAAALSCRMSRAAATGRR